MGPEESTRPREGVKKMTKTKRWPFEKPLLEGPTAAIPKA